MQVLLAARRMGGVGPLAVGLARPDVGAVLVDRFLVEAVRHQGGVEAVAAARIAGDAVQDLGPIHQEADLALFQFLKAAVALIHGLMPTAACGRAAVGLV